VAICDFPACLCPLVAGRFRVDRQPVSTVRLPGRSRLHTGKINPTSRSEKWGSKNPVHGLLLLEGWKVMLVG